MKEGESEAGGKVVEILEEGEQGGSWMAPRIWDGTRSRKLSGVGRVIISIGCLASMPWERFKEKSTPWHRD